MIKLKIKIILSFLLIVFLLTFANIISTYYILGNISEKLKDTEILFAKDISNNIYRYVIDQDIVKLTNILFEKKSLAGDKIEYILVFDVDGYLLAHTYLDIMPKQLLKLGKNIGSHNDIIKKIENDEISVYDIGTPIMEGINEVGSIHIGIKTSQIDTVIKNTFYNSLIIGLSSLVIGILMSFIITKRIIKNTNLVNKK